MYPCRFIRKPFGYSLLPIPLQYRGPRYLQSSFNVSTYMYLYIMIYILTIYCYSMDSWRTSMWQLFCINYNFQLINMQIHLPNSVSTGPTLLQKTLFLNFRVFGPACAKLLTHIQTQAYISLIATSCSAKKGHSSHRTYTMTDDRQVICKPSSKRKRV
jgi:hypothetical protein